MTRMEKYRYDVAQANAPRGMEIGHEELYVLVDAEELIYLAQVFCYCLIFLLYGM